LAHPVLTLPCEITTEIFLHFIPVYPRCPPLTGLFSPILLTYVCRKWREIAFSTPSLWRAMSLSFERYYNHRTVAFVKAWLARSHSRSLSIRLVGRARNSSLAEVMEPLAPRRANWEHIHGLVVSPDELSWLQGELPSLCHLDLTLFNAPSAFSVVTTLSSSALPKLRSAILDFRAARWVVLPWRQLTTLTLRNVCSLDFTAILQQTPCLLHLTLALRTISIHFSGQPAVELPPLQSLALVAADRLHHSARYYLEAFIVPALRKLQIPDGYLVPDPFSTLEAFFLQSGCTLEALRITGKTSMPKTWYRAAFPSIARLSFSSDLMYWTPWEVSDDDDDDDVADVGTSTEPPTT
ncbi:hypothetical protein C8R43DRAFT_905037, partial [Mycena crocata]